MPRLLPRLVNALKNAPSRPTPSVEKPARNTQQLFDRPPPTFPSISPAGRSTSILLDRDVVDTFGEIKRYRRRRGAPPRLVHTEHVDVHAAGANACREMTPEERTWWSNPYLRMLSTPIRQCKMTKRYLPQAFLIRLAPKNVLGPRASKPIQVLFPDGLEHRSITPPRSGYGHYVICRSDALDQIQERGTQKRIPGGAIFSPRLKEQISHLLRLRVLQELRVLQTRLAYSGAKQLAGAPILRKLTRAEWNAYRESRVLPYPRALAVLVVPPLNMDKTTKTRPQPSGETSMPPEAHPSEDKARPPTRAPPPLSELCPISEKGIGEKGRGPNDDGRWLKLGNVMSRARIPLYHGLTLFPSRTQRAALHARLSKVLEAERIARKKAAASNPEQRKDGGGRGKGDAKASHAFMLCADSENVLRADAVPLAIALWRVRMWEGAGWKNSEQTSGGWIYNDNLRPGRRRTLRKVATRR